MCMLLRSALWITLSALATAVAADDQVPAPPDPNAQRLAAATAEKAEWDARKAKLDYQNAAGPASGLTNAVELKDKAGAMEANLLFA